VKRSARWQVPGARWNVKLGILLFLALASWRAIAAGTAFTGHLSQALGPAAVAKLQPGTGPASAASDWPLYRGTPQQRGVAPGKLASRLKVIWRFRTRGPVTSSPVVAEGRVFVGSGDRFVYALRLDNGRKIWSFKTGDAVEAPPCVIGDAVVVGSADGVLYSLDAASGGLRWKYRTEDKILGAANRAPEPGGRGTWVVVGSYDNRVHCVDAATGKAVWQYETGNYVNGTPAISDGKVIFGGCDGVLYVLRLADGKLLNSIRIEDYIAASTAADGRYAYLGHYGGEFLCVDLSSGKIAWRYRDRRFPYFSSPAVTASRVVVGGRDKQLHCLDRRDGKPIWTFRTRGKVDSSPIVCDNKVVVGSADGRLYLVGLEDGRELWSYTIGGPVLSSPAVVRAPRRADAMVLVGADDGAVYAFGGT
jgi:eukaryotic-like serine/threonine-protein kinase